jgi:hypothetical protein
MDKHKLIELQKIVVRIRSLIEEVEIATNVKLNSLYIANLKDELESLRWTARIIQWVLDRAVDGQRHLGVNRTQLELDDIKKFEIMLYDKIQEHIQIQYMDLIWNIQQIGASQNLKHLQTPQLIRLLILFHLFLPIPI